MTREIVPLVVRGFIMVGLVATVMFGFHSCMQEDHRHSEEMRRIQLNCVERGE